MKAISRLLSECIIANHTGPANNWPLPMEGMGMLTRLPEQEYHAHPALSSGNARMLLNKSPLHVRHHIDNRTDNKTPAMQIGTLFHGMVLGRGTMPAIYPQDCYKSDGGLNPKPAAAFRDSLEGDQVAVKLDDMANLQGMAKSATEALATLGITINPDHSEQQIYTEIEGCPVRAMYDYIPSDHRLPIIDLKKTQDASPRAVAKSMQKYGYDFQREWYGDIYKQETGRDREFLFLFVEENPPHAWLFATPDFMTREINQKKCRRARNIWRQCLETNTWHGYMNGVLQYSMPSWQVTQTLEEEE